MMYSWLKECMYSYAYFSENRFSYFYDLLSYFNNNGFVAKIIL